jgi:glucose-1-phosphate thymidylyltransferase
MKGLILSGGRGTRLRPLTFTRAKQLIPIANKPNLFYVVEDLAGAGVTDIGVIISPETGGEIRQALGDGGRWGVRFTFIQQDTPLGLAHAVKCARGFLGDDPFVMYLGDNLLSGGIVDLVNEFRQGQADSIVLLTPVENPSQFGVAAVDSAGNIVRLIEKPKDPPSNLALVGVYIFKPIIHDVIEQLQPSGRGEYEITDAIQGLIDRRRKVVAHQVRGWWKDTGKPGDLLEANHLVLSRVARNVSGQVENSELVGAVVVEEGARIINSRVRGPVHIAAGALVADSYVGPYTSVGPGAKILRSEVENSILLQSALVQDLNRRLDSSLVGQDAVVIGGDPAVQRNTVNLVIGDASQVKL